MISSAVAFKPLLSLEFDRVDRHLTPALAELIGGKSVRISSNSALLMPQMVGIDAPRPPLFVGGLITRSVDFCDGLSFMCWADFDGRFLAPIDKYDVAGVAVTRGGREECIGGLIMPIEAEIR